MQIVKMVNSYFPDIVNALDATLNVKVGILQQLWYLTGKAYLYIIIEEVVISVRRAQILKVILSWIK